MPETFNALRFRTRNVPETQFCGALKAALY